MTDYERIKREYDLSLLQKNRLMDKVWPVGSIYMSLDATDPSVRFGGVWERIQNAFLLAASDAHPAGESGGEENHALTIDEMPNISGTIEMHGVGTGTSIAGATGVFYGGYYQSSYAQPVGNASAGSFAYIGLAFGGNQPHNNMPPYLAVYIWKRIK